MYYQARELALNNGRCYHLVAILRRNRKVVKIGENTSKTHPRFLREYPDGSWAAHMHAEMNVLRFAQPGDKIEVLRFKKDDHARTMAKPCSFCLNHMINAGIVQVKYTNWNGTWETLRLNDERTIGQN